MIGIAKSIAFAKGAVVASTTVLLLNFNTTNGSTTFTDSSASPLTVAAIGNAQVTTTSPKFGTGACLLDGAGDAISITGSPAGLTFGTGAFGIQLWLNFTSVGTPTVFDWRPSGTNGAYPTLYITGATLHYYCGAMGTPDHAGTTTLTTGSYYHIEVSRYAGTTRVFLNGVLEMSFPDTIDYLCAGPVYFGANTDGSFGVAGKYDCINVKKGEAFHTADTTFTPPSAELTS